MNRDKEILGAWIGDGVILPQGTEIRMRHKGQVRHGMIESGYLNIVGNLFSYLSPAAEAVAEDIAGKETNLNGWRLFDVKSPDTEKWIPINNLRQKKRS